AAQQNMPVRPVLLKRNSLDSADLLRQPQHRRTKSQQVRFKDEGVKAKTGLGAARDTAFPTGEGEIFREHGFLLHRSPSFPRAQKGLRNIAIQTSPSLRKHFPVFKRKKLTASKSLTEMPTEPAGSVQLNGNLSEEDIMSADLCYLRITSHLEDGLGHGEVGSQFSPRASKAQSNGPIHSAGVSGSEKTAASTQVPEYIHVSHPLGSSVATGAPDTSTSNSLHSPTVTNSSGKNESSSLPSACEREHQGLSNCTCSECHPHAGSWEAERELLGASRDAGSEETTPLSPPSNPSSPPCFLRDYQEAGEPQPDASCVPLTTDDHTSTSVSSSNPAKSVLSCNTEMEKDSTRADVSPCNSCSEGLCIKSYLQGDDINPQTNKEINEINQIHLADGELSALQGRLQSVEESLQSNQEKIKVLLNVIQDLEKSRALSEGRNFYHTGQDLNNCSTCQNTACIIYSVEHDFRQQEGRFHQILKMLDHAEQNPASASPQKLPSDHPAPEKKELRRKTKKVKRKCFWWI
ncbi:F196B protein, partial [Alcedo cyanopectus]|nr:F196B protein [Ceyx cyanopectus]